MSDYKIEAMNSRADKLKTLGAEPLENRYDLTTPNGLSDAQAKLSEIGLGNAIKIRAPKGKQQ